MTHNFEQERVNACAAAGLGIPDGFFTQLYMTSGRPFPWRSEETDPFCLLVAEILLKQTRAEMVAKVWPSIVSRYSNADEMASAIPSELFDMIKVLGFGNQRVQALINVASSIAQLGEIPTQPEDLSRLPYVGIYTAHAVACFSFGQRVPVVDLSIVRVISRLWGIKQPSDIRRAKEIWDVAWSLLPQQHFKEHNYGLLDFAALVCKPRSPRCNLCSLVTICTYAKCVLTERETPFPSEQS